MSISASCVDRYDGGRSARYRPQLATSIVTDELKILGCWHRIRHAYGACEFGIHDRTWGIRMATAERVTKFMHEDEPEILGVSVGIHRNGTVARVVDTDGILGRRSPGKFELFFCQG